MERSVNSRWDRNPSSSHSAPDTPAGRCRRTKLRPGRPSAVRRSVNHCEIELLTSAGWYKEETAGRAGTYLKIVHQAEVFGGPFVLLFGVVRYANRLTRHYHATLQFIQRYHRTLVHGFKERIVVCRLEEGKCENEEMEKQINYTHCMLSDTELFERQLILPSPDRKGSFW